MPCYLKSASGNVTIYLIDGVKVIDEKTVVLTGDGEKSIIFDGNKLKANKFYKVVAEYSGDDYYNSNVDFKYYYDGISKSVAEFIEKIDLERQAVAKAAGCPIESVAEWMRRTYKVKGKDLYECICNNESYREIDAPPSIHCRYILEDVPNGLVPIEILGKELGVLTPNVSIIIDLASTILNIDFRKTGRAFSMKTVKQYI